MDQLAEYRARQQQRFAQEKQREHRQQEVSQQEDEGNSRSQEALTELDIIREINRARGDPRAYAATVRARLAHFNGNDYFPPEHGGKTAIVTKEGTAAVQDALAFLEKQAPLPHLAMENVPMLRLAAEDHLTDLGPQGVIGHQGSDGSSSSQRISRYGRWLGKCGENLWFGRAGSRAAKIVEDLIIDDGVASRGHRHGIFDPRFQFAGICSGSHKTFGACVVMEFAEGFVANASLVNARTARGPTKVSTGRKVQTQWSLGTCPGCCETINGGSVVEALGKKWHRTCFVCANCKSSLVGVKYRTVDTRPLCLPCESVLLEGSAQVNQKSNKSSSSLSRAGIRTICASNATCSPCGDRTSGRSSSVPQRKRPLHTGGAAVPRDMSRAARAVGNLSKGYGDI